MTTSISFSNFSLVTIFVLLAAAAISSEASRGQKLKKTEMTFYMHDWETPTKEENVTNIIIAGKPQTKWYILTFGSLFAYDDAITTTIDRNSNELGRAHGIYVNTALDGSDSHILVSFLFTNKAYNGSTIEIQGADRLLQPTREVSIVSGRVSFAWPEDGRASKRYSWTFLNPMPFSDGTLLFSITKSPYHTFYRLVVLCLILFPVFFFSQNLRS